MVLDSGNLYCFIGATLIVLSVNQIINTSIQVLRDEKVSYLTSFLRSFVVIDVFILLFKSRHDWERLKSDDYDTSKVQAIYSKPNSIVSLLGATGPLGFKFKVRYSYNGRTIRFKKDNPNPVMVDTYIKNTDIIKDTKYDGDYFNSRFNEIKDKKYNIFTFNCGSLINKKNNITRAVIYRILLTLLLFYIALQLL